MAGDVPTEQATCCIVGGGPAGVMLGFLLARAGLDVLVLEKHKDFFRDFRGDTIHPSTLELLYELGLLDEFLRRPHQEIREISAYFGDRQVHIADLTHLPTHCKFVALMPQWDFLDFLSEHARRYPGFKLRMGHEAVDLLSENDRITGVKVRTPGGSVEVKAKLVVACDGRSSVIRAKAGLEVIDLGAPIDVLWFRVSRKSSDPPAVFGFVCPGQFVVLIDRDEYWQCAYVIRKGSFEERRQRGLEAFRQSLAGCTPFLADRVSEIKEWDDVKLLSVRVDHLRKWHRDGLLCIGDAAHAMSPVGGVGINLAIQDAVAAARILAPALLKGRADDQHLAAVRNRRERPTQLTQRMQIFLHEHLIEPIFNSRQVIEPPLFLKMTERFPRLRRLPARMIGLGFRPEHVK